MKIKINFKDVDQLACGIYRLRGILKEMFQHRRDVDFTKEDAYKITTPENLQYALRMGIIREFDDVLEIEEKYLRFFEEVLHTNEMISPSLIADQLENLKDNVRYYLQARNRPREQRKYLQNIRRILGDIPEIAINNAYDLKENVNYTFKEISNYDNKREKLHKYRAIVDSIYKMINDTHEFLNDNQSVFRDLSQDFSMSSLITNVRLSLNEVSRDLIERQKVICDYLNKIEYQNQLMKKIRKIKNLKDQMLWLSTTNVKEMVSEISSLFFNPQMITLRPSLTFLVDTDEGRAIVDEVRCRINRKIQRQEISVPIITQEELNIEPEIREIVDIQALSNSFFASGLDLFRFVITYKFQPDKDFESRVSIYIQLFGENADHLEIKDEIETYQNVSYPLIYPKSS